MDPDIQRMLQEIGLGADGKPADPTSTPVEAVDPRMRLRPTAAITTELAMKWAAEIHSYMDGMDGLEKARKVLKLGENAIDDEHDFGLIGPATRASYNVLYGVVTHLPSVVGMWFIPLTGSENVGLIAWCTDLRVASSNMTGAQPDHAHNLHLSQNYIHNVIAHWLAREMYLAQAQKLSSVPVRAFVTMAYMGKNYSHKMATGHYMFECAPQDEVEQKIREYIGLEPLSDEDLKGKFQHDAFRDLIDDISNKLRRFRIDPDADPD